MNDALAKSRHAVQQITRAMPVVQDDHRRPALAPDLAHDIVDERDPRRIEVVVRFIEQEEPRALQEESRQREAALHPRGERSHDFAPLPLESYASQYLGNASVVDSQHATGEAKILLR